MHKSGDERKHNHDDPENEHYYGHYNIKGNVLGRVKSYERPLVDEKKDQPGNPPEYITEESGNVFIQAFSGHSSGLSSNGSGDRCTPCPTLRGTLRSTALRTKRGIACVLTTRFAKCHESTSRTINCARRVAKARW
jgi:hypothetical protein